jgi:hypothetical protein
MRHRNLGHGVGAWLGLVRGLRIGLVVAYGCSGGTPSRSQDGAAGGGGAPVDASDTPIETSGAGGNPAHAPADHRQTAPTSPCPIERRVGATFGSCADGGLTQCVGDGDCAAGLNGRCLESVAACVTACSYDECATDSDCPGNVPCSCRSSASDSAPNACLSGSNCRIDADCGPGGYCSRGTLGDRCNGHPFICQLNCGRGYFCHNSKDTCVDDTDCTNSGLCVYDLDSQSWTCSAGACAS